MMPRDFLLVESPRSEEFLVNDQVPPCNHLYCSPPDATQASDESVPQVVASIISNIRQILESGADAAELAFVSIMQRVERDHGSDMIFQLLNSPEFREMHSQVIRL